jgi:hypothetical protein
MDTGGKGSRKYEKKKRYNLLIAGYLETEHFEHTTFIIRKVKYGS